MPEFDTKSVSVRLDGQASIEHQLDIHLIDLSDASDNVDISIMDILQGLKYVMDYRLAGAKMPHLNIELMRKLCHGLLELTIKKKGNLLNQKPTEEADLAFSLFGDFVANIIEFRQVLAEISISDLRYKLAIHRRCQPKSSKEQRVAAASLLGLMTLRFPQFSDWHDIVEKDSHDDVEALMKEYPEKFTAPAMPMAETIFPPPALYFDKNSLDLAIMFNSSVEKGLTGEQVVQLRQHYGTNTLPPPPKGSILKMMWGQLTDFMVIVLLVASIVEFIAEDISAGIVLLAVIVINVIIGVTQEYKANQALEALLTLTVAKASVIRNGVQSIIDAAELVPGDLVVIEEGEAVPADLRLCEIAQLDIIEAILTGESLPVSKSIRTIRKKTRKLPLGDCKGNAFMTTVASRGRGKGIVVRTGVSTEIGKISSAIAATPHTKTNIEKKLGQLGLWLVIISIALVIIIVGIGLGYKRPAKETILVGVSLAVSVIPEGLVAVVTISMALGVQRMAKLNAIVRKLPSVETVGSVTVICSDKTGTLTEGKMGAQQIWTSDNSNFIITHSTNLDPSRGEIQQTSSLSLDSGMKSNSISETHAPKAVSKSIENIPGPLLATLMVASCCNNSGVNKTEAGWKSIGDPTEVALLIAGIKGGLSRDWFASDCGMEKIGEFAFDSDRKMMSSVYGATEKSPTALSKDAAFVLAKGAPEAITKRCSGYLLQEDQEKSKGVKFLSNFPTAPMTDEYIEFLSTQCASLASCGLRVLAMAVRKVNIESGKEIINSGKHTEAENDLTFVGLIGLIDPPKPGVKESITTSKKAGIRVIMITGDHVQTATAIAKDLGIIDATDKRTMQGFEIDLLSEELLCLQNPFPVVFARVSPDNKLKIVKALQRTGNSVIMTGDGVNDAPAIKQADVGVAMGIAGTEITKQAADIVLATDDFTTIVIAVREGRQVYDNILKFVVYLLSCNFAEVLLFLICASINIDLPFTTIQILWANIFADIPPALSLGLEPAEADLMDRKPRPPKQNVLTGLKICVIFFQALSMTLLTFTIYYLSVKNGFLGADTTIKQRSLAFVTLTTMQLVQSFLSRSIMNSVLFTGILGNRILVYCFFLSFGLLLFGVEVPPIAKWLELTDPGGLGWAACFVCTSIHIINVEVFKLIVRTFFGDVEQGPSRKPMIAQISPRLAQ